MKQRKNREGTEALGRPYRVTLDEVGREMETLCIVNIPICRVVVDGFNSVQSVTTRRLDSVCVNICLS